MSACVDYQVKIETSLTGIRSSLTHVNLQVAFFPGHLFPSFLSHLQIFAFQEKKKIKKIAECATQNLKCENRQDTPHPIQCCGKKKWSSLGVKVHVNRKELMSCCSHLTDYCVFLQNMK